MGKLKRKKQRLHVSAVRQSPLKGSTTPVQSPPEEQDTNEVSTVNVTRSSNLFSGLNIDPQLLSKKLPADFDMRSTITNKSLKGLNLKKKERKKIKHDTWMHKINSIQVAKKQEKEKKRRQKTVIVGDMSVIEDALPTLELLMKGSDSKTDKSDKVTKVRGIAKEKTRQKQMLKDISMFQEVLEHPAFKENPTATIAEHLRNKLKQEEEMDT
ncbi:protein FAM207A-like isoform X2 [Gigantopelta aegis]|nr:protein FAM207A-like isoform X2 [Gigantopelta aegis]